MLIALLLAQTTPVQPLPPANLPPPGAEEAAVLAPVERLFAAIAARDAQAVLRDARPDGRLTAVVEAADGTKTVRDMSWAEFAQRIGSGTERAEERSGQPAVEIDGGIAMVWAPYTFLIAGRVHHCGTNHFDLVRDGDRWKLYNITWSHRTTGCAAP